MPWESQLQKRNRVKCAAAAAALFLMMAGAAAAEEPIKIGLGMSLAGPLAANGKMSLVAMQVWESDINAQGGLLGRPVKLVYYDDQSKPAEVPAIYSKLLDVDKVDLIVSGYASTQIAAAMPVAVARKKPVRQPVRHRRQQRVQVRQGRQPNVGSSSLINVLIENATKVRAT
jgi:branched-chain amino acid transport system substrate-binding protein